MTNLYFPICGLFCILLIVILFFTKKRVDTKETKIYGLMIISSLLNTIFVVSELLIAYLNYNEITEIIIKIINKCDFIHYIFWTTLLFLYAYHITYNNKKVYDKIKKVTMIIGVVSIIIEFLLPIELIYNNEIMGVTGTSSIFVYIIAFLYIIATVIILILNIKKIFQKKYIPMLVLIILMIIAAILRVVHPTLIVIPTILVYIDLIMYHTIENPDMKMIEELNIAKKEADVANNAKTEFLANMSHEIRTPLNAITGFSQALAEEEGMPESAKEDIKDIIMASNSLLEIVNGVLDISKIEAGKIEIINKTYTPFDMFKELESLTKVRIGEKPIELRTYIDATIPKRLFGDHVRIKQIILNLLTNAAKYTEEGYIDFKVSSVIKEDVCRLIISVEDTGMGIKTDQVDKLFNKFSRLDEEKNITIEGTGLGLAITKKLLELMNGKITVQSIYGEGSKFTAYIDQKIVREEQKEENIEEVIENLETQNETQSSTLDNRKVLIVDDNKLNLKVAQKLLSKYNLLVTTLESGVECIEHIERGEQYDIILLDDMMPKMSGKETLKKLKENENFKIPTIALTANAISGMKEEYLALGFDDYLAKPIEKIELERVLKEYLD